MSGIATRQRGSEADFEAIELAVMETERGRWFLAEYARRNRHADTEMLLAALSRIERSVGAQRDVTGLDKVRLDILEMSRAIARTHAEIEAIKPDAQSGGPIVEASGELDSIVAATESATSDILAAAERVQEAAWTLREANADPAICDLLDARATEIYTACSFQDLTAQRTRKVIEVLAFLERRVAAMVDIWQISDGAETSGPEARAQAADPSGMSQADVDSVLVEERGPAAPAPAIPLPMGEEIDEILFSPPEPVRPAGAERLQLVHDAVPPPAAGRGPEPVPAPAVQALNKMRAGAELSADEAARALDALRAMSVEERTRLFS
jgi:hypothetical protein